jgi:hypothetical protein
MVHAGNRAGCQPPAADLMVLAAWKLCSQPPGSIAHPDELPQQASGWLPAVVPGTVAAALQALGRWQATWGDRGKRIKRRPRTEFLTLGPTIPSRSGRPSSQSRGPCRVDSQDPCRHAECRPGYV